MSETNEKGRMTYFGVNDVWILDKFKPSEIALFFREGAKLFEKLEHTEKSQEYLEDHPELAELVERW